ncbi:MAG: histone deacetylase [Planctomycetota bacterium]
MEKFSALRDQLLADELIAPASIIEPEPCPWRSLALIHDPAYLAALRTGTMARSAVRRMGFPWTERLVRRSRLAVQGTINAMRMALSDGIAGNLAGGTHHAMPAHAEGFCVLNDVAVALTVLRQEGAIERALVVDLDVHQGNGTAACLADCPHLFTFSMHGRNNFPLKKERSDRDVPLDDRLGGDAYLRGLEAELSALPDRVCARAGGSPDLIVYLGGVDVLADDKFGRLGLTQGDLTARDRMVCEWVRTLGVPLCLLLSGGYSPTPEQTAANHAVMYREAIRVFAQAGPHAIACS